MQDSDEYRLRVRALTRKGMSVKRAEMVAFEEFKTKGAKDGRESDIKQRV